MKRWASDSHHELAASSVIVRSFTERFILVVLQKEDEQF